MLQLRKTHGRTTTRDKNHFGKIQILSLARYGFGGPAAPQIPPASPGKPKAPLDLCPQGPPDCLCAQARSARTAREHEALMAKSMMSIHTWSGRPLPTWKTSIVVTATIFILFKANTKETSPLFWWRPQAVIFVCWR